eukprot:1156915-Pelagomonas_calceolata.AAC.4
MATPQIDAALDEHNQALVANLCHALAHGCLSEQRVRSAGANPVQKGTRVGLRVRADGQVAGFQLFLTAASSLQPGEVFRCASQACGSFSLIDVGTPQTQSFHCLRGSKASKNGSNCSPSAQLVCVSHHAAFQKACDALVKISFQDSSTHVSSQLPATCAGPSAIKEPCAATLQQAQTTKKHADGGVKRK